MLVENTVLKMIADYINSGKRAGSRLVTELDQANLLVQTDDGTYTLRSTEGTELMHSRIGALKEAYEKFILPSKISQMENPKLLDLCSGLGYNSLAALEANRTVRIQMVEYSRELLFLGSCLDLNLKGKEILDKSIEDYFAGRINTQIQIFCGDARKEVPKMDAGHFDIVFHDGFSPTNDPVLYTVEFLSLIRSRMNSRGILLSYSSSIPFRKALIEAGFHVGSGPSVGRKRGITIAAVSPDDERIVSRLPPDDEKMMALATVGSPFHDPNLDLDGESISRNREIERNRLRQEGNCLSVKKIKQHKIDSQFDRIALESSDSREAVIRMNRHLLFPVDK